MKNLLLVLSCVLLAESSFCQKISATRTIKNIIFKIPFLDGFDLLDSTTSSYVKTNGNFNVVTFQNNNFQNDLSIYGIYNIQNDLTLQNFNSLKQSLIQKFESQPTFKGQLPIENILKVFETYYKDEPDSIEFIKQAISKGTIDKDVNLITSKPTILFNESYGLIISYNVAVEYQNFSIKTYMVQYAGMFLLKNKYFGLSGSVFTDNLEYKDSLETNIKRFTSNLILLNK